MEEDDPMDPLPGLVTDSDSCYSDGSVSDSSDTPWEDEYNDKDLVSATLTKKKRQRIKGNQRQNHAPERTG